MSPTCLPILVAALVLAASSVHALPGYDKDADLACPAAATISQSYETVYGDVVSIESGDQVVVQTPKDRRTVRLVGVAAPGTDTPLGAASRDNLARRLRSKKVELWYIGRESEHSGKMEGAAVVRVHASFRDIGLDQLENGFAKLEDFGPYSLDGRDDCLYRNAEARAKAKHRGVWTAR